MRYTPNVEGRPAHRRHQSRISEVSVYLTAGQWAAQFEEALRDRAEIENRIAAKEGFDGGVFEPFFPGFKRRDDSGETRYHLCSGGLRGLREDQDASKPLERMCAAATRAGLRVKYLPTVRRRSWPSLFDRREIQIMRFYQDRPLGAFYTVSHELAHFVLHRKRPKDPEIIEMETGIIEGFLLRKCVEQVESPAPIRLTIRTPVPDDFEFLAAEFRPTPYFPPIRSKRQMLASRERILTGAAMIEDLFRC